MQATLADQFMEDLEGGADEREDSTPSPSNQTSSKGQTSSSEPAVVMKIGADKEDTADGTGDEDESDEEMADLQDESAASTADLTAVMNLSKQSGAMESDEYLRRIGELLNPGVNLADRFRDVQALTRVLSSARLLKHLQQISPLLDDAEARKSTSEQKLLPRTNFEDHPEYDLVVQSNKLVTEIDDEIAVLHKYLR